MIKTADLSKEDTVLEVGPGGGVLTRALAKEAKLVVAVEKDEKLAIRLKNSLYQEEINNVEIITGDILINFHQIGRDYNLQAASYKIVANIPYYLTSRLFRVIFENGPLPKSAVLTIQQEVAQRIVAKPPNTNLLALSVQAFSTPKIIKTVPAECFYPKPKVVSSIILLSDISDKFFKNNKIDQKLFFSTLKSAFSQKRKLITNTLKNIADKNSIELALKSAGLKKTARPQEVSLKQWLYIITKL